jgi:membrane protein
MTTRPPSATRTALRNRTRPRCRTGDVAEKRSKVVPHEAGQGAGRGGGDCRPPVVAHDVDVAVPGHGVHLSDLRAVAKGVRVSQHRIGETGELSRLLVRHARDDRLAPALEDNGGPDVVRDPQKAVERVLRVHRQEHTAAMGHPFAKFFADRGPHLAAMIAYFALLSIVPLIFIALALLGLFGRVDESTYLVTELQSILPSASISQIVRVVNQIRDNAATLGLIGGVFLLWSSLSLFSVLESALNIVYGRPNRSFLHGKGLAVIVMLGSLITLFVGLVIGTVGFELLHDAAPGLIANRWVAYVLSLIASTTAVFVFLVSIYYLLPNERLTFREVLPGAVLTSILLQVSFQALPLYVALSQREEALTLRALGAPVLLLIWLYVMANAIVFGAEINWWLARGRYEDRDAVPGLA